MKSLLCTFSRTFLKLSTSQCHKGNQIIKDKLNNYEALKLLVVQVFDITFLVFNCFC